MVDAEVTVTPHAPLVAALGVARLSQTEVLNIDSARDAVPQMMSSRRRGNPRIGEPTFIDHVFAEDVRMDTGVTQRYPVQFRIPLQAAPTVKGKFARITWEISAWVVSQSDRISSTNSVLANLARGRAGHSAQELVVFAHRDGTIFGGDRLPEQPEAARDYRHVSMELALASGRVSNGSVVGGSLQLRAHRSFTAKELRVELMRWERSGNKQTRVVEAREVLQRPAGLTAGEETEWAFRLLVPDRLMPTVLGQHTFVGWQVKAVISRAFRPDLSVTQPVQIYTSPAGAG